MFEMLSVSGLESEKKRQYNNFFLLRIQYICMHADADTYTRTHSTINFITTNQVRSIAYIVVIWIQILIK